MNLQCVKQILPKPAQGHEMMRMLYWLQHQAQVDSHFYLKGKNV